MKPLAYFDETLVLLHPQVSDRWDLITQLVDRMLGSPVLQAQKHDISRALLLQKIKEREEERATGLGHGVAFPHARIEGLSQPVVALALVDPPLDFGSLDGKPVSIVLLIVVPEDQPQTALQLIAQSARLFASPEKRSAFLAQSGVSAFYAYIQEHVVEKDVLLKARDIMRTPTHIVNPGTPLKEVTQLMNEQRLDTVPVCEEDGTLVGEITCDNLFKLGMPHFFTQLKSVAFIREFDPFEKYFADESHALAQDVMVRDFCAMPLKATLLEIVFELAIHQRPQVYIVQDKKCIGVIDRILVLERVIDV